MWRQISANPTWRPAVLCLLVMTLASRAEAQGIAASFSQLRLLVRSGDTITVTDTTGREVTGKIVELSASSLGLLVGGTRRELTEPDVTTIRQRRSDSLANGAVWGLGVGSGLAAAAIALSRGGDMEAGWAVLAVAVYGSIGVGIGVGVDALITRPQVIYERPSPSRATVTVSPVLTGERKGVFVSMRF